jgi:hypothetical protein
MVVQTAPEQVRPDAQQSFPVTHVTVAWPDPCTVTGVGGMVTVVGMTV